jgi:hypothetical protein
MAEKATPKGQQAEVTQDQIWAKMLEGQSHPELYGAFPIFGK